MRRDFSLVVLVCALIGCAAEEGDRAIVQAVAGPSGVTVTVRAVDQLAVSWTAVPTATKYYVFQAPQGQPLAFAASILDSGGGIPPTSFIATGLTPGVTYCFAVSSQFPDGSESSQSAAVCAGSPGGGVPLPDDNLTVRDLTVNGAFNVTNSLSISANGAAVFSGAPFVFANSLNPVIFSGGQTVTGDVQRFSGVDRGQRVVAVSNALTISGTVNDWAPAQLVGGAASIIVRVTGSGTLTGIAGGVNGRIIYLQNIGTGTIQLADETMSATANQFRFPTRATMALQPEFGVELWYDASTVGVWRLLSKNF